MNKTCLFAVSMALLVVPLSHAHDANNRLATPDGTTKLYCEPTSEWPVHDYGPVADGITLGPAIDGNIEPCVPGLWDLRLVSGSCPPGYTQTGILFGLSVCRRLHPDGHKEFAEGGAWLLACDQACGPDGVGGGALSCWGEQAHHGLGVTVTDVAWGNSATFTIGADYFDAAAIAAGTPQDPCGDLLVDVSMDCIGSCTIPFAAGVDGAYQVFVLGTQGHVTAPP